jgi:hypothetical protein
VRRGKQRTTIRKFVRNELDLIDTQKRPLDPEVHVVLAMRAVDLLTGKKTSTKPHGIKSMLPTSSNY